MCVSSGFVGVNVGMKREMKKSRNLDALAMILQSRGGKHQNSRNKRTAQKDRRFDAAAY